jgi:thioesterase domain-containing protein
MAQQLRAAGHEVAFLKLLETWPPARRSALRALLLRQSQHLRFLSAAIRRNLGELPRMSPRKALGAMLRWARIVGEMISRQDIYRGDSAAMYVDRVSLSNHKAFCAYRPRPYDGSALLVLASARRIHGSQDPRLSWGRLVRSYAKEEIPALDSGLVLKSPHVESLARIMTQYLRDSRQESAVQPAGATPSAHAGVSVSASVSLNT